ncbi:hypothetical protein PF010_g23295 [Phytophthora fragariae]|uniref:Uncharacterized protein n=1 Tax=Phytophthora fragariae TaxID=53985 RepID=A0A6G0K6V5_9STRA|nr:hypothetical protein PF010_g23295 [Phytophthora fragariae]KAE9189850.1 hypothetical protein PF004_g22081 [Phytophthora fragariae]KAE9286086.1 hypothetical protein PF008_g26752 [Phytophthora fragariae]
MRVQWKELKFEKKNMSGEEGRAERFGRRHEQELWQLKLKWQKLRWLKLQENQELRNSLRKRCTRLLVLRHEIRIIG